MADDAEILGLPDELFTHAVLALGDVAAERTTVIDWNMLATAIRTQLAAAKLTYDDALVAELCWLLVLRGLVAPAPHVFVNASGVVPGPWHVTELGRVVLADCRPLPIQPSRYLGACARELQLAGLPFDPITREYMREGSECFAAGHYRAAVVMNGCALENELRLLARLLRELPQCTDKVRKQMADREQISVCREGIHKALEQVASGQPDVWGKDHDAWQEWARYAAEHLAKVRNAAGHPTGREITRVGALISHLWLAESLPLMGRMRLTAAALKEAP